jgi:hypothetical protein
MINNGSITRMPALAPPVLNWEEPKANLKVAPKQGANSSFSYIAQTPKYAEAYSTLGPYGSYYSYLSYNHGNQPWLAKDTGLWIAWSTPTQPNFYALSKVTPKTSAAGVLQAQKTMGSLLQLRQPYITQSPS